MAYLKLFMQVVVTFALAIVAAMTGDDVITSVEWVNVAIVAVTAGSVFYAPNIPGAPITKFVLSALGAVLVVLASSITDGLQTVEIIQMVIAGAGAVGVYAIPNRGQTVSHDDVSGNAALA